LLVSMAIAVYRGRCCRYKRIRKALLGAVCTRDSLCPAALDRGVMEGYTLLLKVPYLVTTVAL